ncbi:4-hydroxybenzoate polyprenyltransferase [Paenibacillaceae bacterium GAS479]|nr:4-hydroxybenzoate polyprenyltransferase [Paenibacillaceae bacterium GAS479]
MQGSKLEMVRSNSFIALIEQLRPKQWTKNILVFAALIFSLQVATLEAVLQTVIGFFLFSFTSSCVYILNDFLDLDADRAHPTKRFRPMASGALSPSIALPFGVLLLLSSLGMGFYLNVPFGLLLCTYFIMNVAYCLVLKHVVIVDVMTIAAGFVFRAIGGGLVIGVPLTPWFLVCTMLLSLFLAISKRLHEFKQAEKHGLTPRKVLQFYNAELLGQMSSIVTTATIISYALFTFSSGNTIQLMWTIPFVLYGIFRYLYLIHVEGKGGSPDKLLFEDKPILITVILYGISVVFILTYFE